MNAQDDGQQQEMKRMEKEKLLRGEMELIFEMKYR